MGLNPFLWGWKLGNSIADFFTPQLITADEERRAIEDAERQKTNQYRPPKAYVPVGDTEYQVPLPPAPVAPSPGKNFYPPPTIRTTATVQEAYIQPQAGFPNWWQWLPGPWLYNQLRKKPEVHQPTAVKGLFQFGRLMVDNHSEAPLEMPEWDYMVEAGESQVALQASSDAFAWWIAKNGGAPNPGPQVGDFYDQGALLWAVDLRAYNQGVALMYGIQAPADAFANMWIRSRNALSMIPRGTTYQALNISPISAVNQRNYYEWQAEVDSGVGGAGLATSISNLMQGLKDSVPRIVLENSGGGIKQIQRALATDQFPFSVPISLLLEPEDIKGKADEEIYQQIESVPQLLLWLTKALDELIGKFPITMEIAENDLLDMDDEFKKWESSPPPGVSDLPFYLRNDKMVSYRRSNGLIVKTVKVPNLAEAIAEILGINLAEKTTNDLAVEMLTRTMTEIGSTKAVAVNANAWIEAVADYLGFESKDVTQNVEYTYNPLLQTKESQPISWQQLLKPTEVPTAMPQFSDKLTFEAKFELIKEIHAIVKAALTEGIGKSDGQMLSRLKDFAKEMGITPKDPDKNNDGNSDQPKEKDDFDRFLEDVEWGFIGQGAWAAEGQTKPYGRELGQRPRIKRLGSQTTDSA
ncbi:hypothetical protein [Synechocystis salina]|uniref:Portal protein n=1 Tax=Synechocystis salina LEGE 00031 TaxID=1828736 RepID=A0ABR9VUZ7_9SYNC|nr:hypothetical protein [Synechocystis salina]MBE9239684.1 hypothetical protein [Synechocystis salina LEGE 00041]MBE9254061.1 hypothetical protein [Synechocystis salina LEGE 00031]